MASGDPSGEAAKKKASSKKTSKDNKKQSSKDKSSSHNNKRRSSGQGQGGDAGAYVSPPDFFSFNDPGDDFSTN
ncbi:hypothetical protein GGR52DRAFT_574498 [Hypoxylon sp. FL1284]|nr:hypothetical protein GGR52DRAFT_574498 [Hypoxylon sp. FL1284]